MNKHNNEKEVNDTDKKLHISDVMPNAMTTVQQTNITA